MIRLPVISTIYSWSRWLWGRMRNSMSIAHGAICVYALDIFISHGIAKYLYDI